MKLCTPSTLLLLLGGTALLWPSRTPAITDADRLHAYNVNTSQHATDLYLTNLGPTGARGWIYMNRIYVHDVEAGSPADGRLKKGDYLLGVNGQAFPENDPRAMLGNAITETEAGAGNLRLRVGNKGREREETVALQVMGARAPGWPFDCKKSAAVRDGALHWLREHQKPDGSFGLSVYSAMNGLFLLSSPAPQDQEAARRCIYSRADGPPADELNAWCYGYSALALAEYYLLTGDAVVLPRLEFYAREIAAGQTKSGSWCHGMVKEGVPGGYGELNQAGVVCFLSLVMMQECGIPVDPVALAKATHFFGRYAGLGCIPYGDNRPWDRWPSSTGKDAVAAVAFRLLGEPEKVRAFAESVCLEARYTEDAHTGAFWGSTWLSIGASLAKDDAFHNFLNAQNWYYELERRWDGGFKYLPNPENLTGITGFEGGPMTVTGGFGLVYALPLKRLRILGAEAGPFGKNGLPALKPAAALFRDKQWKAFDAWMKTKKQDLAEPAVRAQAQQWASKREALQAQVDWTLAAVAEMTSQDGLTRANGDRARAMLKAVERLAGDDLPPAKRLYAQLDAVKDRPADPSPPALAKEAPDSWMPLLPLAKDLKQDAPPKTWRVYAWTGDISPGLDNLEPAGLSTQGWYLPEFDDSEWEPKTAPFRAHKSYRDAPYKGQASSPVSHHDCMYQPRPLYNTYARLVFDVENTADLRAARIVQQNGHQYLRSEVYLNGYRVAAILRPKTCELTAEALTLLHKGENTLAVYLASCRGHLHDFDFGLEVEKK